MVRALGRKIIAPNGRILERVSFCFTQGLVEGRLGITRRMPGGTDTIVYSSVLKIGNRFIPVVLKFWMEDLKLASQTIGIHNNYIALAKLRKLGLISTIKVPTLFFSFIETEEGELISLLTDKRVTQRIIREIGAINNQLAILEDIRKGRNVETIDNTNENYVPEELISGVSSDLKRIRTKIPTGDPMGNDLLLMQALIIAQSVPPEVWIADIDKLKPIYWPKKQST